jgi:hypothetical protein
VPDAQGVPDSQGTPDSQNPQDCAGGTCSDPSRPFCDQDGSLSGHPSTCIAVACTPAQLALCRGDQAVTCNAAGTNYDVVSCALGCDAAAGGCRQCTENGQCGASSPVCDVPTSTCRVCRLDDECPSKVCNLDAGTCVAVDSVVYASPTGSGRCLLSQPCQIEEAVDTAVQSASILRLLPGLYQRSLDVHVAIGPPLEVVATGATISPSTTPAIVVRDGARVAVRGLSTTAQFHIACGAANSTPSTLSVRDMSFETLGNGAPAIDVTRCALSIASTEISLNAAELAISVGTDGTLIADRLHMRADNTGHILASGTNVTVRITNSVFDDVLLDLNTGDTIDPGSSFGFAFDTFATRFSALDFGISAKPHRTVAFENSIIARDGALDAVVGSQCSFRGVVLSHQAAVPAGAVVQDPKFADAAARNFHLLPGSPAVNAAVEPSAGLGSTHDFDGRLRPQGAKPDIGAYELAQP